MKILVAGASGYLGGRVTEYLADAGMEVIAQLRNYPENSDLWISKTAGIRCGDIRTPEMIQSIADCNPDAVIYTISLTHKISEENSANALETNVTPVWKLLDALGENCRRFLYFSTQQVYGKIQQGECITESREPRPRNNYGLTHLMCEDICRFFAEKRDGKFVSLRISNGFGAPALSSSDCWRLVVNDFCQAARREREIRLLSDGTPLRDFIHVADICRATALLLEVPDNKLTHDVYNLGGGRTYSILDLAILVANVFFKMYASEIPIYINNKSVDRHSIKSLSSKYVYDTQRLKSLGFQTGFSIEKGIEEIFTYLDTKGP